ncbi:uncharacterized protein Pyn_20655 [Prunus yedoensis var. nudiflora]|uniref:Uncharacterized protein n=1 Tax=Prunus yedoensis var. nudiflora TaxID=2094558 RepID=A0A314UYA0_PRUYE|nr:uncharacterized protein Pyn_20655 [Prunus yedoensis var. nudiflora]
MEVSTATLQPSCSFPLRVPKTATRDRASSLSFVRNSSRSISLSSKITNGCLLPVKQLVRPVAAATVGDTTAVPNDCSSAEELSVSDSSNATLVEDESRGSGEKGEEKAFSKEWDDIRPHFYKRCQDRADTEDDPGMKHKLLRLGRKLKEIDEDVQRHNELLKVVRGAPSEISEIVSRRRKDFTQEFFVHVHTVAESYYDNPTEQNGLASIGNTCLAAVQAYDSATESIEH